MTVVLRDVDVTKRSKNDYVTNAGSLLTLYEYIEIAKRCIGAFAPSSNLSKNDDAIAHVAEQLMLGHLRWKEDGGRTLHSYLNQCAIWAIKSWKSKLYQEKKPFSLNSSRHIGSGERDSCQLYQLIPDKKSLEPFEVLFDNNTKEVQDLIESDCLTQPQRYCLKQRYIENQKLREIGNSLGISRQAVHLHIKKAISRLRKEFAS